MGIDYGLRVSSRVLHGPLWRLSPRALRLWTFLAAKSQHAPFARTLSDGQRVTVRGGQVLTSQRQIAREAGYTSSKAVVADVKELTTAKVIACQRIEGRFQNGTGGGSESESGGRFQNGTAKPIMATLVTIYGVSHLREGGGSESEPKREGEALRAISKSELEWQRAQSQLAAEGR
jgi:hypothetical protein